jgi:hypothetical protein
VKARVRIPGKACAWRKACDWKMSHTVSHYEQPSALIRLGTVATPLASDGRQRHTARRARLGAPLIHRTTLMHRTACSSSQAPSRLAYLRLPIGPYARSRSSVTALPPPRLTRPRGRRALAGKGPPSQRAASSHWCRRRGGARRRQGTRRGAPWPTGRGCPSATRTRSVSSPRP